MILQFTLQGSLKLNHLYYLMLSKLPSPCSNFSCSCTSTPCVLYILLIAGCHKGLF